MTFRIVRAVLFGTITFFVVETELGIGKGTSLLGMAWIALATAVGFFLGRRGKKEEG